MVTLNGESLTVEQVAAVARGEDRRQLLQNPLLPHSRQIRLHAIDLRDSSGRPHDPNRLHRNSRLQLGQVYLSGSRRGFSPFTTPPAH